VSLVYRRAERSIRKPASIAFAMEDKISPGLRPNPVVESRMRSDVNLTSAFRNPRVSQCVGAITLLLENL